MVPVESEMATRLASATITQLIVDYAAAAAASTKTSSSSSGGVLLVMGQDASYSPSCRKVLNTAKDDATSVNTLSRRGNLLTLPFTSRNLVLAA